MRRKAAAAFAAAVLAAVLACMLCGCASEYAEQDLPEKAGYVRTQDIHIRDVGILAHEGKYYMYGMYPCSVEDGGYACYVSEDLQYWQGPYDVFLKDWYPEFEGTSCYWAPECHYYNGKFYLFGTYQSAETGRRGTSVFAAESPLGPFEEWSEGHITPHEWNAIDGTLYVDEEGNPWMAFVHEWVDEGEGSMCVVRLSEDLKSTQGEVKTIFYAKDPLWSNNKVTDAPWLYMASGGVLVMIWSNSDLLDNYAVGIAYSESGKIDGEWKHRAYPLCQKGTRFAEDGGHGCIFTDFNGNLVLAFHSPGFVKEGDHPERVRFYKLEDTGDSLKVAGQLF